MLVIQGFLKSLFNNVLDMIIQHSLYALSYNIIVDNCTTPKNSIGVVQLLNPVI